MMSGQLMTDVSGFVPQIGLAGALLGGLLSLISPCSALLVPSFFAYAFQNVGSLIVRTAVFYLGLAVVLVPLGAGAGAIGSLLTEHRSTVTTIGGFTMIVLGVAVIFGGGFALPGISGWIGRLKLGSSVTVFALGALYGLAGFCAGPLLGGVLTVAAAGGSAGYGGLLMGVYALGMAAPLFVLALLWDRFKLGQRGWLRGKEIHIGPVRTHTTSLISGLLFVAIGILFLVTAGTANLGGLVGVDTEYDLQVWLRNVTGLFSDAGMLFALIVVALAALIVRIVVLRARDRHEPTDPVSEDTSTEDRKTEVHQ